MPASPRSSRQSMALSPAPDEIEGRPAPLRVDWEILGPDIIAAWGRPRGEIMPEHVAIYGQTRSGKTYLQAVLLMMRVRARGSNVVVLATKPADKTILSMGWPIIYHWPPRNDEEPHQLIYWAKRPLADGKRSMAVRTAIQRESVEELLDGLFVEDSNTILVWDEVAYVENVLGLRSYVEMYLREGAGLGITNITNTQRGARVSRFIHSESSWSYAFKPKDRDDTERVAEILGDRKYFIPVLNSLDAVKREFVVVHTLTGEVYISHIPDGFLEKIRPRKKDNSGVRRSM